jgi:hypothetical protein
MRRAKMSFRAFTGCSPFAAKFQEQSLGNGVFGDFSSRRGFQ